LVLAVFVMVGLVVYVLFSFRIGKRELGSEIELAANRTPHVDDFELETRVLDRSLAWSLVTLAAISLVLPMYWLMEPARQENAAIDWVGRFEVKGARTFEEGCASCHGPGGVGGVAAFTIADPDGEFVAQVDWKAPALTTVLSRFSEEEVIDILDYGRPGTPMPAWGLPGGGPLTAQQVEQLVVYMRSIQLDQDAATAEIDSGLRAGVGAIVTTVDPSLTDRVAIDAAIDAWLETATDPASDSYLSYGELLFNNASAQGANNCARCHTPGFSFGATSKAATADLLETWPRLSESGILTGWQPGAGHVGPDLAGVEAHFSTSQRQSEFIGTGSEVGIGFGNARTGSGGMPGYGGRVDDLDVVGAVERSWLLTPEQIDAVVAYERSL
ncbi:MAG: cytochrome c, partial [Acidimicrobiales bacterium]|nr:cytochrome c [Acidimicrobiales bacterium]